MEERRGESLLFDLFYTDFVAGNINQSFNEDWQQQQLVWSQRREEGKK